MPISVIDLSSYVIQCAICEREFEQTLSAPSFGVARYEDEVVPDDYKGEWGGAPVCERCYWVERGMHAKNPAEFLSFADIRRAAA